jgi:FUN14 domain-containing protein 1
MPINNENNGGFNEYIRKALDSTKSFSGMESVIIGGVAGLTTGYFLNKVGRLAAFSVGTSVIVLQVAQHMGYIEIKMGKKSSELDELKKKALKAANGFKDELGFGEKKSESKIEQAANEVKEFFKNNFTFGASYVGGCLIGLAI